MNRIVKVDAGEDCEHVGLEKGHQQVEGQKRDGHAKRQNRAHPAHSTQRAQHTYEARKDLNRNMAGENIAKQTNAVRERARNKGNHLNGANERYIGTRLVPLCFDFYMIEAKPENLIGDRAYDSDPLDEELRKDGIEMIAPHRANRIKPPSQDRRRLSRYMRRWLVERFFAWIQWQRRILVR